MHTIAASARQQRLAPARPAVSRVIDRLLSGRTDVIRGGNNLHRIKRIDANVRLAARHALRA